MPDTLQIGFNDFNALDNIDDHTACVVIEPVQAEAGVIYPATGFLENSEKDARKKALLVFDEVQTALEESEKCSQ